MDGRMNETASASWDGAAVPVSELGVADVCGPEADSACNGAKIDESEGVFVMSRKDSEDDSGAKDKGDESVDRAIVTGNARYGWGVAFGRLSERVRVDRGKR